MQITKEQAQKIIDAADEVITALAGTNEDVHPESDSMLRLWDDLNDRYAPPEVVRELARIALASLEAEPVGTFKKGPCGYHPSFHEDAVPLYTATPASVSVPDEATPENISILSSTFAPRGVTYQWDRDECNAAADSWNAFRAAMLQGADSPDYRAIVERISEIVHGKVTDIDLLTVTVKSMKDKLHDRLGNSPVIPDWQSEAEKLSELYGIGFVVFQNGESPRCADPTKVIISFTDKGLWHGAAAL